MFQHLESCRPTPTCRLVAAPPHPPLFGTVGRLRSPRSTQTCARRYCRAELRHPERDPERHPERNPERHPERHPEGAELRDRRRFHALRIEDDADAWPCESAWNREP